MSPTAPIALVQETAEPDHFRGVEAALRARGAAAQRIVLEQQYPRLGRGTRVVAVSDVSFLALSVLRQARRIGAATVLLMDGITEYRNTFENPRVEHDFLRPAPVDVVACAGRVDERHLRGLGNDAIATGLPRLAGITESPRPARRRVLVATARQPAFADAERARLVAALRKLGERLGRAGVEARWRLTGGLEIDLGVPIDETPLKESLRSVRAVITTPSTLLVEAMLAGRPAGLLFPFDAPLWPRAAWVLGAETLADDRRIDETIESLLDPGDEGLARQERVLDEMHGGDRPAAEALADLLIEMVDRPRRKSPPRGRVDPMRLPPAVPARPGRPRVVSLVHCGVSPVGGVTTWSSRLARAFADEDLGYDVMTLLVVTHPDSLPGSLDGLTQACVIDPTADQWLAVRTLREALERLEPAIVLPNYADLCWAAAMQLRFAGVRTVAVAHTDHGSCRRLFEVYDRWDGAVAVSGACRSWLEPMAGVRPVAGIVYGVPVAPVPRRAAGHGPLILAYVGRMVEYQKRISDLLGVIDGLETRGVDYVFHVIGDGEDSGSWRQSLSRRRLPPGRVVLHGRREPEWVERFLRDVDASVLVSDYEGTSITMLEAMGAGVVPAVTRVSSGVSEWIRDGGNGVVVPIGAPDEMARRLAELAGDRGRLAAMGREAWRTVRGAIGLDLMARQYRDLFDRVLARPVDRRPSDTGLRLCDSYTWAREWVERPDDALAWIRSILHEAGYRSVAMETPAPGCDAVIVRGGDEPVEKRVEAYRARGLGVAVWPHLIESPVTDRMQRAARDAVAAGCRRIAIYGAGRHTRRAAGVFEQGLPIVGLIDDDPPPRGEAFGLPVVPMERALPELKPDAVLLSSDTWEERLWHRSAPLRAAGVRVLPLYGSYDD